MEHSGLCDRVITLKTLKFSRGVAIVFNLIVNFFVMKLLKDFKITVALAVFWLNRINSTVT